MVKKNLLLIIGIALMLIFPVVTALEFDNAKSYNTETKTATITNAFGLGDKIAEVKLDTPQNNYVIYGKDRKVAEYTISSYQNYNNVFSGISFINLKTGRTTARAITYKYKTSEDYSINVPILKEVCETYDDKVNGTGLRDVCHNEITGWTTETKQREAWVSLTSELSTLPKGNITIGIFTDVEIGESIEWIPTLFGVSINEWAVWTEALNTGLKTYYNFENILDDVATGNNDLTDAGTTAFNATGKIGVGLTCDGTATSYATRAGSDLPTGDNTRTMVAWVTSDDTGGGIFGYGNTASTRNVYQFSIESGNTMHNTYGDDQQIHAGAPSAWQFYTARYTAGSNNIELFKNGVNVANNTLGGSLATNANPNIYVCNIGWDTNLLTGTVDEAGVWDRALSNDEIIQLYNGGTGITWSNGGITATQSFPAMGSTTMDTTPNFGCNFTTFVNNNVTSVNITIYNASDFLTYTNTESGLNQEDYNKTWTSSTLEDGTYNWACYGYGSKGVNASTGNWTITINANTPAFNNFSMVNSTYESIYNNFEVNLTYNSDVYTSATANLIYGGTSYVGTKIGTGDTILFNRTLAAPAVSADNTNKSVYWEVALTNATATRYFNSSFGNQTVSMMHWNRCNSTFNIPFLNITFKDEVSGSNINATISTSAWNYFVKGGDSTINRSLSFSNLSLNNKNYDFCFVPAYKNATINMQMSYAFTGYPQKSYSFDGTYGNSTTNITLYLLASADGSYTTFQVLNSGGTPISGVSVLATRVIDSVVTTVGSGETGGDGGITFWVNPDYVHTFTFSKSGYDTYVVTLTPTQSLYTITLAGGTTEVNVTDYHRSITTAIAPNFRNLSKDTAYTFQLNLTSSYWTLTNWGFNITNTSGALLGTQSSVANGGSISTSVNTQNNSNLYMNYWWIANGNYTTNSPVVFTIYRTINDSWSLNNAVRDLKAYTGAGTSGTGIFGLDAFGRTIIIFLVIFLLIGSISYVSGLYSPMAILVEATILITLFDGVLGLLDYPFTLGGVLAGLPLYTILIWVGLIGYIIKEVTT